MFKSLVSYSAANAISGLASFMAMPMLARALGPEDFARAALFVSTVWVFNVVCGLNVTAAFNVRYKKAGQAGMESFASSAFAVVGLLTVFWVVVLAVLGERIGRFVGLEDRLIMLALVGSAFNVYFQVYQGLQMMQGNAIGYGTMQMTNAALTAGLSVILALHMAYPLNGRIFGLMIPYVLYGLLSFVKLRRAGLLKASRVSIGGMKDVMAFCLPLLPHMAGVFLFAVADRFLAVRLAGEHAAAKYLAAIGIINAVALITAAFNRATIPYLYEHLSSGNERDVKKVQNVIDAYVLGAIVIAIPGFVFAEPMLRMFFGAGYEGAGRILAVLLLMQGFFACYTTAANILMFYEKSGELSKITVLSGILNVMLLWVCYREFGIIGIAYSGTIAMAIRYFAVMRCASKFVAVKAFDLSRIRIRV